MERGGFLKVLLDTAALIDLLKGEKNAMAKAEELKKEAALYTTTINIYEILRGINLLPPKSKERHVQALRVLVSNLNLLDIDADAAGAAASVYADLRKKGTEIDPPDYLIAGACLANGIGLILTRNEKHFGRISGLKALTY